MLYKKAYLISFFLFIFCYVASAQIPVDKERHHQVVLENKYIRLLEGKIPFKDTTVAHLHAANSEIIFLSHSIFGIEIAGEKPVVSEVNPGDLKYAAYRDKPVIHKVWNQRKDVLHFMVVEIIDQHIDSNDCTILSQPGIKFQSHQKFLNTYSLDITKGRQLHLQKSNCNRLLIRILGAINIISSDNKTAVSTGSFAFFPSQKEIWISSNSKNARYILLELK